MARRFRALFIALMLIGSLAPSPLNAAAPQLPTAPAHAARAQPNTLSWIGEPTSGLRQLCRDAKEPFGDTIIPAGSWVDVIATSGAWCYVYWPAGGRYAWILRDALCP
jgi:hypothetical protein